MYHSHMHQRYWDLHRAHQSLVDEMKAIADALGFGGNQAPPVTPVQPNQPMVVVVPAPNAAAATTPAPVVVVQQAPQVTASPVAAGEIPVAN